MTKLDAGVYWCARDLAVPPNHHFILVAISDGDILDPSPEEEDGTRFFTLAATRTGDGELAYALSEPDDVLSVRKYISPKKYTSTLKLDLDFQRHKVLPPGDVDEKTFATQVVQLAMNYEQNTKEAKPKYSLMDENCAGWVNTLFAVVGVSEAEREKAGEFWGVDWGEGDLINRTLFSPVASLKSFTMGRRSIDDLPAVLAGPILRRADTEGVSVWLAVKEAQEEISIEISDASNVKVRTGKGSTIKLGENLHIVTVTADVPVNGNALKWGETYFYGLSDGDGNDLLSEQSLGSGVSITYSDEPRPSFILPPEDVNALHFFHASCRKPHGEGHDMLAYLDKLMKQSFTEKRPQMLFLTGDQIYADDVASSLLFNLRDAAEALGMGDEKWPDDVDDEKKSFFPGNRSQLVRDTAKFSVDENVSGNHLATFGEFCMMHLFAWSDVLWPDLTQQYDDHMDSLKQFKEGLGAVRRVLANVPTYMIFDDHEVTDDLFLNRAWCQKALRSAVGHQIIENGLLAYTLFQAWGNTPEQFKDNEPGKKLLELAQKVQTSERPTFRDDLSQILGLPSAQTMDDWKADSTVEMNADQVDDAFTYSYHYDGANFQVLVLNTRTHRTFPKGDVDEAAGLIGVEGLKKIPPRELAPEISLIVSPAPVIDVDWLMRFKWFWLPKAFGDWELWGEEPEAFRRLLTYCARLGPKKQEKHETKAVFLTGDIHFGYASKVGFSVAEGDSVAAANATFAHFTASALRNEDWKTRFAQGKGYSLWTSGVPEPKLEKLSNDQLTCMQRTYVSGVQSDPQPTGETSPFAELSQFIGAAKKHREGVPDGRQIVGHSNLGEIVLKEEGEVLTAVQVLHWIPPERNSDSDIALKTTYEVPLTIEEIQCSEA